MEWETLKRPQEKEKEEKKEAGARASLARATSYIASLAKAEMAKERGDVKRVNPQAEALEQKAEVIGKKAKVEKRRKKREKEEEIAHTEREIGMLQKLTELMARDGVFENHQERWDLGRVSCVPQRMQQNGWKVFIVALERSKFMLRWEWGELLGVYIAELNNQLDLRSYTRILPDKIEEFPEVVGFLREKGLDDNLEGKVAKWKAFLLKKRLEEEEREKRSQRHKALTPTELEFLDTLAQSGGKTHVITLGGKIGYSSNYARAVMKSLGRYDYVDYKGTGICTLTPKGEEELRRRGKIKGEQ